MKKDEIVKIKVINHKYKSVPAIEEYGIQFAHNKKTKKIWKAYCTIL